MYGRIQDFGNINGRVGFQVNVNSIFHQILRSRWVPNANEIDTNNMKCTCPTQTQLYRIKRKPYSTGSRCGSCWVLYRFALGIIDSRWGDALGSQGVLDNNMVVSPTRNVGVGVCRCWCVSVSTSVSVSVCLCARVCVHMHVCIHVCVHMYEGV